MFSIVSSTDNKLSLDGFSSQTNTNASILFKGESVIIRKSGDDIPNYEGKKNVLCGFASGEGIRTGTHNVVLGWKGGVGFKDKNGPFQW